MSKRICFVLFAMVVGFLAFVPKARGQFTVDAYIPDASGSGPLTGTCTNTQWENLFFSGTFGYPASDYLYYGQSVYECELFGPNGLEDECVQATTTYDTDEAECTVSTADNPPSGTYQVVGTLAVQPWYDSDEVFCGPDSPYLDPLDLEDTDPPSFNGVGYVVGNGQGLNCTTLSSIIAAYSQETYTFNQVAVTISPASASVTAGGQAVTFNATVANATSTGVSWSSDTSTGTFTPSGNSATYTPPATIASQSTFTITATSAQNPLQSAHATLTVNPLIPAVVSINPASWTAGTSFALTITGTGFTTTTQVTISSPSWVINSSCSYVNATTLTCTVAIPANLAPVTASQGATIVVSDGSFSATYPIAGTISIAPVIYNYTVTLAVPSPSLTYGYSTSITPIVTCKTATGTACASGVSNPQEAYFKLLSGPGLISLSGLQTSTTFIASSMIPYPSQNSVVQACAPLQTSSCATTTLSTGGITITLNPSTVTTALSAGKTQTFSASIQNPGEATTNALTWTLSPSTGTLTSTATNISGSASSGTSSNTYTAASPINTTSVTLSVCMTANASICATPVSIPLSPGSTFSLSASPTALTVQPGGSGTSTVTTAALGGFSSAITFSASGPKTRFGTGALPAGVTVTFSPNSIAAPGSGTCTANFAVSSTVAAGDYSIIITGTGGGVTQTTTVTLLVPGGYTLSTSLSAMTIVEGSSGASTLTVAVAGYPSGSSVNFSAAGQPSGVTVSFSGNSLNPDGSTYAIMTIAVGAGVAVGTSNITVTGTTQPYGAVQTATVALTVIRPAPTVLPSPGIINTIAGNGSVGYNGDGELALNADLDNTYDVAVDSAGNIYLADQGNQRIRKVTVSTGAITTVAGIGIEGYSGDGGPAIDAELFFPSGVAVDSAGNIYFSDYQNERIRVIYEGGAVAAGLIQLENPGVTPVAGDIYTIAGNGTAGYNGDGIPATSAEMWAPNGIVVDNAGNIYFADQMNDRIRKVTASSGYISTVAGNGTGGGSGNGGAATSAELNEPFGAAVDSAGDIYIDDGYNQQIRVVYQGGAVVAGLIRLENPGVTPVVGDIYTIAGDGTSGYNGDGILATSAELSTPFGVATDSAGNVYIADDFNERVRKVSASTGDISTFAGNGNYGFAGDTGAAISAELWAPCAVAVDSAGNIYIADVFNGRVRVVGAP